MKNSTHVTDAGYTEKVTLCKDGKYRWIYAFDMLKNPTILFTVWKVLGISGLSVWLFAMVFELLDGRVDLEMIISNARTFLLITLILCALGVAAYLIVAAQYGWRYLVLFEMDEKGVTHRIMKQQFDKAKAAAWLTAAAGVVLGKPAMAGIGLDAATRDFLTTDFDKVKKMKVSRYRNTVFLSAPFSHNQIYVCSEDMDFVIRYISRRIPTAENKKEP